MKSTQRIFQIITLFICGTLNAQMSQSIMKELKIDTVIPDLNNGDGVYKVRNKNSKLWGIYQFKKELVPMKFDSLEHIPFNGNFSAVYLNGKVGIYLSEWTFGEHTKQSVECTYEDFGRVNVQKRKEYGVVTEEYLALKKDGKWGWVDWLTGEEKSEFKYNTIDDLPYPYYEQKTWFDE